MDKPSKKYQEYVERKRRTELEHYRETQIIKDKYATLIKEETYAINQKYKKILSAIDEDYADEIKSEEERKNAMVNTRQKELDDTQPGFRKASASAVQFIMSHHNYYHNVSNYHNYYDDPSYDDLYDECVVLRFSHNGDDYVILTNGDVYIEDGYDAIRLIANIITDSPEEFREKTGFTTNPELLKE